MVGGKFQWLRHRRGRNTWFFHSLVSLCRHPWISCQHTLCHGQEHVLLNQGLPLLEELVHHFIGEGLGPGKCQYFWLSYGQNCLVSCLKAFDPVLARNVFLETIITAQRCHKRTNNLLDFTTPLRNPTLCPLFR